MAELQAVLTNEIRLYLQHVEKAIIALRKAQQRNSAITPLLQAHGGTTSPRRPSSPTVVVEERDSTGISNLLSRDVTRKIVILSYANIAIYYAKLRHVIFTISWCMLHRMYQDTGT